MRMLTDYKVTFEERCRAFADEGIKLNRIMVDPSGRVWVWNQATQDYSTLHVLGPRTIYRMRAIARRVAKRTQVYQTGLMKGLPVEDEA